MQMNEIKFEHWPTSRLIPYARNPRKNDHVVDQMAAAITEFGFRIPIIARSTGEVVDGHLRLKAALRLGLETVPVILADDLTPAQIKAFRILANRSATWADWDEDLLALEMEELRDSEIDALLTGFNQDEIDALLAEATPQGNTDPDDVPEVPAEPVSKPGDVWVLGNHRIMCGDSTNAEHVSLLLGLVKPHLMVTDPPYGVEYKPEWRAQAGVNKNKAKMGEVLNDDRADWREAWALFPGDVAYVWHAGLFAGVVADSLAACGFSVRSQIVWAKDRFALSRGHYHWQNEPCWYAVKGTGHWQGDRSQSTLWPIKSRDDSGVGHGTQKPVECMKRPIENNSSPGQAVYEPFSGSGTTIIAAEMTGRCCFAMELNPAYVDVAVKRWEDFTGKKAVLEGAGG